MMPRQVAPPTAEERAATRVHRHKNVSGYGVEPCPGCGLLPQPGDVRAYDLDRGRTWHEACWDGEGLL